MATAAGDAEEGVQPGSHVCPGEAGADALGAPLAIEKYPPASPQQDHRLPRRPHAPGHLPKPSHGGLRTNSHQKQPNQTHTGAISGVRVHMSVHL